MAEHQSRSFNPRPASGAKGKPARQTFNSRQVSIRAPRAGRKEERKMSRPDSRWFQSAPRERGERKAELLGLYRSAVSIRAPRAGRKKRG